MGARPAAARPKATCGNGVAEQGEACDGADLRNSTCQSVGFAGGTLACDGTCHFDTSMCLSVVGVCGDGVKDPWEECDAGTTCADLGFAYGTLVCNPGCTADTSKCTNTRWVDNGDGTVTDNLTRLQWEQKDGADGVENFQDPHDVDNGYSWGDLAGCAYVGCSNGTVHTDFLGRLNYSVSDDATTMLNPGFAGHTDWRLPTIQELKTIVDFDSPWCANGPCVDPIFGASENIYGTSTTHTLQPYGVYTWIIYFWTGVPHPLWKSSDAFHFRAVRSL